MNIAYMLESASQIRQLVNVCFRGKPWKKKVTITLHVGAIKAG